ncbi:TonB-dependent receptor plug domain-containing protein [Amphritea sp.]|uniref:TonB-dependent receptor plug domain-containing protein n=1 Tax=Amphritea sp. TaxID=1872502 RepID=UPI003D1465CF
MKYMKAYVLLGVYGVSAPLAAATNSVDNTIVVTATQVEQSIQDVDASIEVVTREEIESFSSRSLAEVLKQSTGLEVTDGGSSSSVSIRGFNSTHTLILVDGLRRTEKYAGNNVNNISLQNIERIEIVRGPMSALYGSDALGGVINIITQKADKDLSRIRLTLGGAESPAGRETVIVHASRDFVTASSSHSLGIEYKQRNPYENDNGTLNEEQRTFLNYRGRYDLRDDIQLTLGAEYLDQNDKKADDSGRFESEKRYQLNGRYTQQFDTDQFDLDLSQGYSDALVNRGSGEESTDFRQTQLEGRYAGLFNDIHLYNLGAGYRQDDVDISINTQSVDRDNYYLFLQDQWSLTDSVNLTVGIRHDNYNDFGSTTNPRLSLSWSDGPWKIRGSYGTAFSAPSLVQMYSTFTRNGYGTSIINGNPDLQPEESVSYELSLGYQLDRGALELTLYRSDVDQLIAAELNSTSGVCPGFSCTKTYLYTNIDKATLEGAEATLSYALTDQQKLSGSLEYLDARDATTHERLTERARWQSRVSLDSEWSSAWSSSIRFRYTGYYYATPSNLMSPYDSHFTTVDTHLNYQLNHSVQLMAGIDNLLNRELPENMELRGTPQDPGSRYYYAGIDLSF